MGRASKDDTVAGIYQAFLGQRTWRQAELAREVGISTKALRERLAELSARGMPLESENDPPHVYWSVSRSWFPGGVAFSGQDAADLVRELWLLPRSGRRDRALSKLLGGVQHRDALCAAAEAIVPAAILSDEVAHREVIEEALLAKAAIRMRYFSAHRGELEWRTVSPARLFVGPPLRLAALCHRSDALRWFRVDGITQASVETSEPFRPSQPAVVKVFIAASADGYHDDSRPIEHVFVVRAPEARWVSKNLIAPMKAEVTASGIRVSASTAGVLPIARFVVGLGGAARAESSPLREVVRELAEGALASAKASPAKAGGHEARLNTHQVRPIRSSK
jgi:predicted DNA-binding transcriptional regulator YafY